MFPALKATGKRLHHGLQQFSSRGAAMQLGRTWTALIIMQVAIAVAALPVAMNYAEQSLELGTRDPATAANDLLRATLVMTREETPAAVDSANYERAFLARFADRTAELIRRLEAEPQVSGVTFASRFPGIEGSAAIEAEGPGAPAENATGQRGSVFFTARTNRVAIDLFDVFDVPVLAGRGFVAADAREGATAVIVTETFAERIAGGANVLGHRVRYARRGDGEIEASPWLEIVGVVPDFADDFTTPNSFDPVMPRLYHAMAAGEAHPAMLAVRIRGGSAASFAARLFARAGAQLGAGVACGLMLAAALDWFGGGGTMGGNAAILLPLVASLIIVVGMLAALGPARRGLAVQPTEALREE